MEFKNIHNLFVILILLDLNNKIKPLKLETQFIEGCYFMIGSNQIKYIAVSLLDKCYTDLNEYSTRKNKPLIPPAYYHESVYDELTDWECREALREAELFKVFESLQEEKYKIKPIDIENYKNGKLALWSQNLTFAIAFKNYDDKESDNIMCDYEPVEKFRIDLSNGETLYTAEVLIPFLHKQSNFKINHTFHSENIIWTQAAKEGWGVKLESEETTTNVVSSEATTLPTTVPTTVIEVSEETTTNVASSEAITPPTTVPTTVIEVSEEISTKVSKVKQNEVVTNQKTVAKVEVTDLFVKALESEGMEVVSNTQKSSIMINLSLNNKTTDESNSTTTVLTKATEDSIEKTSNQAPVANANTTKDPKDKYTNTTASAAIKNDQDKQTIGYLIAIWIIMKIITYRQAVLFIALLIIIDKAQSGANQLYESGPYDCKYYITIDALKNEMIRIHQQCFDDVPKVARSPLLIDLDITAVTSLTEGPCKSAFQRYQLFRLKEVFTKREWAITKEDVDLFHEYLRTSHEIQKRNYTRSIYFEFEDGCTNKSIPTLTEKYDKSYLNVHHSEIPSELWLFSLLPYRNLTLNTSLLFPEQAVNMSAIEEMIISRRQQMNTATTTIQPVVHRTHTVKEERKPTKFNRTSSLSFLEEEMLTHSALHGLYFAQTGVSYVFDQIWNHLFILKLPSFDESFYNKLMNFDCIDFFALLNDNVTKEFFKGRTDNLYETFNQTCYSLEMSIAKNMNSSIETTKMALNDFKTRQLTRNKRELFTALAVGTVAVAGISFATGYILSKDQQIAELNEKFDTLASQMDNLEYNTAVMNDRLIGVTKALADSNELLNNKIDMLQSTTQLQMNSLAFTLGSQIDKVHTNQMILALLTFNTMYKIIKLDTIQQSTILILDLINSWDFIFSDLRRSVLSHSLLSWSKLKPILEEISNKIEYNYELGIDEESYQLYYMLPLVNYQINTEKNELHIHFQVPLKRPRVPNLFRILSIRPLPFPCEQEFCSLFGKQNNSVEFISFEQTQNAWLINHKSLYREAIMDDFTCLATGSRQVCFTFLPHALSMPSECSKNIEKWDNTNILKYCKFKQRSLSEYKPISIGPYKFIIHAKVVPNYFLNCRNREPVEVKPTDFATVIEIQSFCQVYLPSINTTLLGPHEGVLQGESNETHHSFHSTFLDQIKRNFNETNQVFGFNKRQIKDKGEYLRPFNPQEYSLQFEFDNSRLTAISNYLYETQNELANLVYNVDHKYSRSKSYFTLWSYVSILGDTLRIISTLVVIFGIITYSRFLGFFVSSVIVIQSRRVQAFQFPSIYDDQFASNLANVILVILFSFLLILYIKCAYFRTTMIGIYNANCYTNGRHSDFSLIVNIHHRANKFRKIIIEICHIRIPLRDIENEVMDLKIINPLNIWFISKDKELVLAEEIQIYGTNAEGNRILTKSFAIKIPLRNLKWDSNEPDAVSFAYNYNLAIISVLRKSPTYNSNSTSPTRTAPVHKQGKVLARKRTPIKIVEIEIPDKSVDDFELPIYRSEE